MNLSESHSRRRMMMSTAALATGLLTRHQLFGDEKTESMSWSDVETILKTATEAKAFPGCAACCGSSRRIIWQAAIGHLSLHQEQQVELSTLYDLASLTKVIGTTSVAARLLEQQKFSLDDMVTKWLPEFAIEKPETEIARQKNIITIRHLLTHTSGLPAWKPIYKIANSYEETIQTICKNDLEDAPGAKYRYSDLGMMLLGEILSRAGGASLPQLERALVFAPLQMNQTLRNPEKKIRQKVAPTERIGETEEFWQGVVHDENARAGEGITGHAGLFSNVSDLAKFAHAWLSAVRGQKSLFSAQIARQFSSPQKLPGDVRRGLGWQMFAAGGSGGSKLSQAAFGHTGFTGTSIWIDPSRNLYLILLSNRVHPTRQNSRHLTVRREFADAIVDAVEQG